MGVNNRGWTEIQYGLLDASGTLEKGRVAINADGFTLDLGTLGGPNSWDNPFGGEINDRGEAVGYSETSVPDPDGEDVCGFGTDLTCRPFLWQNYHMSAPNLEVNVIGVYPFLPARIRELTAHPSSFSKTSWNLSKNWRLKSTWTSTTSARLSPNSGSNNHIHRKAHCEA
jgi:hypothetical protein